MDRGRPIRKLSLIYQVPSLIKKIEDIMKQTEKTESDGKWTESGDMEIWLNVRGERDLDDSQISVMGK